MINMGSHEAMAPANHGGDHTFNYDPSTTTEGELMAQWKKVTPEDEMNEATLFAQKYLPSGIQLRQWVKGVVVLAGGVPAFESISLAKRFYKLVKEAEIDVVVGPYKHKWLEPIYRSLRPLIVECERSLASQEQKKGQAQDRARINLILSTAMLTDGTPSGYQLAAPLARFFFKLHAEIHTQIKRREQADPDGEYQDYDVLSHLLSYVDRIKNAIDNLATRLTLLGGNGLGKSQLVETLMALLRQLPRGELGAGTGNDGEDDHTDDGHSVLKAVDYVLEQLVKLVDEGEENLRRGVQQADLVTQILSGAHHLVDYKDTTSPEYRVIAEELMKGPEGAGADEEVLRHEQFYRYGEADFTRRLAGVILPIGNDQGASTRFNTIVIPIGAGGPPQLVVRLEPRSQVIEDLQDELPILIGKQESDEPLTTTELGRMERLKGMLLFAMHGRGSATMEVWRINWQEEVKRFDPSSMHADFDALYAKPLRICVGSSDAAAAGDDHHHIATCRFFRSQIMALVAGGATGLFVAEVRLYWPLLVTVEMQDSAGFDANFHHQQVLVKALEKSGYVVIVVEKSLEQGWPANDVIFEPFFMKILRGEVKVVLLQYGEKTRSMSARDFESQHKDGNEWSTNGANDWQKTSFDLLGTKLSTVARKRGMSMDLMSQRLDEIKERSFDARVVLGCSLLMNGDLSARHPGLLEKTNIKKLLRILIEASNEAPLKLARQIRDKIMQHADSIHARRAAIGLDLLPESKEMIHKWRSNHDTWSLWMGAGSSLGTGIMAKVTDVKLTRAFYQSEEGKVLMVEWLTQALNKARDEILDEMNVRCRNGREVMECCKLGKSKDQGEAVAGLYFVEKIRRAINDIDDDTGMRKLDVAFERVREPILTLANELVDFIKKQVIEKAAAAPHKAVREQLKERAIAYYDSCKRPPTLANDIMDSHRKLLSACSTENVPTATSVPRFLMQAVEGRPYSGLNEVRTGGLINMIKAAAATPSTSRGQPSRTKEEAMAWFTSKYDDMSRALVDRFRNHLDAKGKTGLHGKACGTGGGGAAPAAARIHRLKDATGSLSNRLLGVGLFKFEDFFTVPGKSDAFHDKEAGDLQKILRDFIGILDKHIRYFEDSAAVTEVLVEALQKQHHHRRRQHEGQGRGEVAAVGGGGGSAAAAASSSSTNGNKRGGSESDKPSSKRTKTTGTMASKPAAMESISFDDA